MDIPNQNQATEIASAYLKEIREHLGPTGEIQKPELRAWLEHEERLMLQSAPDRPRKINQSTPRHTTKNRNP